ncbi:MAG: sulfatase, partial [Mitsuokella jalaludinii]|nr:sulfatase [Mitsuokella jalaludinii]
MQLSTERQDRLIRWLTASGIYYICLIAFYIDIGQDMGAEYFIPVFLPVMLALVLVQYGTRVPLFSWATLPNLFTGLAWCSAFPLLYTWTYHQDWYMSKICFDFLVGTSLFLLLTALEGALFRLGHEKIIAFFMALLNLFGIVIPFIQYAYYFIVWHCLSPASLMALYLTNWRESIDFIESNVGILPAAIIILGLALFLYACWRGHMAFARRLLAEDTTAGRMGAITLLTVAALGSLYWFLPQSSFADLWKDVDNYVTQTQTYSLGHDERLNSMHIEGAQALPAKAPGTVIVVIGESASRNYMKAFTPDYAYDDTPWQSQQTANP